jgi:hypothetical protein
MEVGLWFGEAAKPTVTPEPGLRTYVAIMIRARGGSSEGQWRLARAGEYLDVRPTSPTRRPRASLDQFRQNAYGTAPAQEEQPEQQPEPRPAPATPAAGARDWTGPVTPPESPPEDSSSSSPPPPPVSPLTPQQLREPLLMAGLRIEDFAPSSDFVYTGENSQHLPAIAPNARYLPPIGWTKLGLRIPSAAGGENWVQTWKVAYHAPKNCRQVIVQTLREGFRVQDGSRVGSRSGPGVKDPRPPIHHIYPGVPANLRAVCHLSGVYCSPDIEYGSLNAQCRECSAPANELTQSACHSWHGMSTPQVHAAPCRGAAQCDRRGFGDRVPRPPGVLRAAPGD